MNKKVSCNNCANYDFCHYRTIAFEQGMISWESHLNQVEKLGCACFKTKLPKEWIVLTKEQIKHPTDDKVIEFFVKHNEKVRKYTAEEIYYKAEKKAHFKDGGYYDKDRYYLDMKDLKEILKQFGVEVEQ